VGSHTLFGRGGEMEVVSWKIVRPLAGGRGEGEGVSNGKFDTSR